MGYIYEPTVYKLIFEEPEMAGFECAMRELSVDELLRLTDLLSADPRQVDARERVLARAEFMAGCIVSWNLEDHDGDARAVTAATLLSMGHRFTVALTAAWLREVVGLTIPPTAMSDSSEDGSSSADEALARLPMEPGDGD